MRVRRSPTRGRVSSLRQGNVEKINRRFSEVKPHGATPEGCVTIKLRTDLEKYCVISADGSCIDRFVCPVEGCGYSTEVPEELRMHLVITTDPRSDGRFSPRHFEYFNQRANELNLEDVKYLSQFQHRKLLTNT